MGNPLDKVSRARQRVVEAGGQLKKAQKDWEQTVVSLGPGYLQMLLERNSDIHDGLTPEQLKQASLLIEKLPIGDECGFCDKGNRKAITGLGLCRGHAGYALDSRK